MIRTPAASGRAREAVALVGALQDHFTSALGALDAPFTPYEWFRDGGRHGGGVRFGASETAHFDRASVNVSSVHYDDEPERRLRSATALSTIIHPAHPRAPSVHVHLSFTELRDVKGTWRFMADLNPSHVNEAHRDRFARALEKVAPALAADARANGDRYFFIPALGRHRGVTHFYVESWAGPDFEEDLALMRKLGLSALDTYLALLADAPTAPPTNAERAQQLAYHTLYFFQVLTLDRGTTSGLLVHDQNDVGIMGSLPSHVDRRLLASWGEKVPKPQDELVRALVAALPGDDVAHVTDEVRATLAKVVRGHYRAHPEALELQAAGNLVPPTVDNHR